MKLLITQLLLLTLSATPLFLCCKLFRVHIADIAQQIEIGNSSCKTAPYTLDRICERSSQLKGLVFSAATIWMLLIWVVMIFTRV